MGYAIVAHRPDVGALRRIGVHLPVVPDPVVGPAPVLAALYAGQPCHWPQVGKLDGATWSPARLGRLTLRSKGLGRELADMADARTFTVRAASSYSTFMSAATETAMEGMPSHKPSSAAPTVPETTISIPMFEPLLMPETTRSMAPRTATRWRGLRSRPGCLRRRSSGCRQRAMASR